MCDHNGQLHNVSVDFGGDDIPLVHRHEARVVSRMFAAEHNTYVFKNYGYTQTADPATERRGPSRDEHANESDSDHEQNAELGDPSFGPSHSEYSNW